MKTSYLIIPLLMLAGWLQAQTNNIGFGTLNPDSSAMLDITATDKGLLIPRMDSTQRLAIPSPAEGLMVYDSSTVSFWYFNGSTWKAFVPEPDPIPSVIIISQLDQSGIAGTSETPLGIFSIPANTLDANGEALDIHAFGEIISDTSIIRIKCGTNTLEFPLTGQGFWDARIRIYRKNTGEIKMAGTISLNGVSVADVLSGLQDFTVNIPFQITAAQNQAVVNGVGMEGLLISRIR